MVKYLCHNCNDLFLKSIASIVEHVWDKHGVEIGRVLQSVMQSEDARIPKRTTGVQRVTGFRCEDCKVSFTDQRSFLAHLDRMHGIHIWYERGLTRKRVYFDGILDSTTKGDTEQQKLFPNSKKYIPLTKRPYEAGDQTVSLVPKKKRNIPLSKRPYEPRKSTPT